jgi:hypothetical protein
MDGPHAKEILEAARSGRVVLAGCRGRSAWERPGQAAELAVRRLTGEDLADALTVNRSDEVPGGWTVHLTHADGRSWRVAVARHAAEPPRPESCGAALGTPVRMDVTTVEAGGAVEAGGGPFTSATV